MKEYKRWALEIVKNSLKTRRISLVLGARQSGKTTLAKQVIARSKTSVFRSLDDINLLTAAYEDPSGFVNANKRTLVIDEIQKAPLLLSEIKKRVDENNATGQFILTGSANISTLPHVKESLAGRVKNIHLRTLTEGEIQNVKPHFIERALQKDFPLQVQTSSKEYILRIALRGGYPEIVRLPQKEHKEWHRDYLHALLTKDLQELVNIRRKDVLQNLMEILAAWSSKYIDLNGICSACAIAKPTLLNYISFIESLYLCEKLPAWVKTDYDRVGRRDKFYMSDTGLMASILNWDYDTLAFDADRSGKLIETLIFHELSAQVDLSIDYSLYHYRDRANHEIDFLIKDDKGSMLGIEVKSGTRIMKEDFKHLIWFGENIIKDPKFLKLILYSGKDTLFFGENLIAVPTALLWAK